MKGDAANLIVTEIELADFFGRHQMWNLSYFKAIALVDCFVSIEIAHSLLLLAI